METESSRRAIKPERVEVQFVIVLYNIRSSLFVIIRLPMNVKLWIVCLDSCVHVGITGAI